MVIAHFLNVSLCGLRSTYLGVTLDFCSFLENFLRMNLSFNIGELVSAIISVNRPSHLLPADGDNTHNNLINLLLSWELEILLTGYMLPRFSRTCFDFWRNWQSSNKEKFFCPTTKKGLESIAQG